MEDTTTMASTSAVSSNLTVDGGFAFSPDALAFSPDGKLLAGGRSNGDLLVWAVPSGKLAAVRESQGGGIRDTGPNQPVDHVGYTSSAHSVAWNADGTVFAVDGSASVSLWRVP